MRLTVTQGTPEWIELRRTGIGASEIGAVLNLDPYTSAAELLDRKLGRIPEQPMSDAMRAGQVFEGAVATLAAERMGWTLVPEPLMYVHDAYPWLYASLDRSTDAGEVVEIKTTRHAGDETDDLRGWGPSGTDRVPARVMAQVQQQMTVAERRVAHVACLIAGADLRIYTIEADPDWSREIVRRGSEFVAVLRAGGTLTPEGPAGGAYADRLYPADTGPVAVGTDADAATVAQLLAVRAELKRLTTEEDELETSLKARIGALAGIEGDGWRVTWKATRPRTLTDWEAIAHDYLGRLSPDERAAVVAAYTTEAAGSRRFTVSTKKGVPA